MPKILRLLLRLRPVPADATPPVRQWAALVIAVASIVPMVLFAHAAMGRGLGPFGWLSDQVWVRVPLGWPHSLFAGVGAMISNDKADLIGDQLAFVASMLVFVAAGRRLWFWWLAVYPGPIVVTALDVADTRAVANDRKAPKTTDPALADYLTVTLREKLLGVSLYLPAPTPGDASGESFLDVMRDSPKDTWWATAVAFLTRLVPRSAYRVNGTVLIRDDASEPYGIAVRLTVLPRRQTVAQTIWAVDPERAAERAANAVAGTVLPMTHHCRQSPWRHRRHRQIPLELLEAYGDAVSFAQMRRYDEALGKYNEALRQDPVNPIIRLAIAQVQERLALYLDALVTYDQILTLWRGPERSSGHRWWLRWYRYGSPFLARFRYALALGYTENLVRQWCQSGDRNARTRERESLREQMGAQLINRYERVWAKIARKSARKFRTVPPAPVRLAEVFGSNNIDEEELGQVLLLMSWYELGRLLHDRRSWRALLDRSGDSRRSLRLTRDPLVEQRLERNFKIDDPPDVGRVTTRIERHLRQKPAILRRLCRKPTWVDHYNAACAYAQTLARYPVPQAPNGQSVRRKLADKAAAQLFAALDRDGDAVRNQRSWILSEDPDLWELRRWRQFRRFAGTLGAADQPATIRPRRPQIAELVRYEADLLSKGAEVMERRWHQREATPFDVHLALDWLEEDARAWWLVHQFAVSNGYWPHRLAAIRFFRDRLPDRGWCVAMPDIMDVIAAADADQVGSDSDTWCEKLIERGNQGLILVGLWIRAEFRQDVTHQRFWRWDAEKWHARLGRIDRTGEDGPSADIVAMACRRLAARWQRLRETLAGLTEEPTSCPERDLLTLIVDEAEAALGVPKQEPWDWSERQRCDYPHTRREMSLAVRYALAGACAALALKYDDDAGHAAKLASQMRPRGVRNGSPVG